MTVTRDQAQMLATLAAACRPTGAQRWDTAGIIAALTSLRERDLATVALATIRAAADRDADTPGVIPTNGHHWREQLAPQTYVPQTAPAGTRCTICGQVEAFEGHGSDHAYRRPQPKADPESVHAVINALKAEVKPGPRRIDAQPAPDRCQAGNCIRAHGHTGPCLPPLPASVLDESAAVAAEEEL